MTALSRRPDNDPHHEGWKIYYEDVRVGHIGQRAGVPVHAEQWGWRCGFYPGLEPGAQRFGTAATFESARAAFEATWTELLPTIPDTAFAEWRHDRDWRAEMAAKRAGREARQRDPEHADALRLRRHVRQLEAGREPSAPATHLRRANGRPGAPMMHVEARPLLPGEDQPKR